MNEIKIFSNEQFGSVRTVINENGDVWFNLKDLCEILSISNDRNVKARLSEKDVRLVDTPTNGGTQQMSFVNEYGMYDAVIRSDSPKARPFQDLLTHEVLPSIRKHGAYMTDLTIEKLVENPDMIIELATKLKKEREQRKLAEQKVDLLSVENKTLKSRQTYLDMVLQCKETICVTQLAQDYGMSAKAFNKLLSEYGIQYKVHGQWVLYSKYLDKGYVQSKTFDIKYTDGTKGVKLNTEFTQKGRIFVYEEMKKHGVYPIIEQNMEEEEV